jgi:O-antigen/teichoic acid export membrane protein
VSILKKLASETALYGLSSIIGRLVTFVFLTPYLTRRFAPDEMGVQTDLYAWAAFLMVIFSYRMETALFRFGKEAADRPAAFRTAMTAMYVSTGFLVLTLLLFSEPIAGALEYTGKGSYVRYFALILGLDALAALPFARLRLAGLARKFAFIKLANLGLQIGSILFLMEVLPFSNYFDPNSRIDYIFIANLVASAGTLVLLLPQMRFVFFDKVSRERLFVAFDKELLKKMLLYSAPLVVAAFAGIINEVLDRILLKIMLEGTLEERLYQVGIYGSCYKIAIFMNLFTQAFNYAAEPFFFKQEKRDDARDLYADVAFIFAILGCLAFVGIGVFMDLAQYFVAARYREGLVIVPILLLANLFLGLYYNVAVWFKLGDKTRYGAYIAFIGAGATIIANVILIPIFGYVGAAWATLICYAAMLVVGYLWGQRHYPIPYDIVRIGAHISAAIGVYLAFVLLSPYLKGDVFLLNQAINALFFGAYAGAIFYLEKARLLTMLKRK